MPDISPKLPIQRSSFFFQYHGVQQAITRLFFTFTFFAPCLSVFILRVVNKGTGLHWFTCKTIMQIHYFA